MTSFREQELHRPSPPYASTSSLTHIHTSREINNCSSLLFGYSSLSFNYIRLFLHSYNTNCEHQHIIFDERALYRAAYYG